MMLEPASARGAGGGRRGISGWSPWWRCTTRRSSATAVDAGARAVGREQPRPQELRGGPGDDGAAGAAPPGWRSCSSPSPASGAAADAGRIAPGGGAGAPGRGSARASRARDGVAAAARELMLLDSPRAAGVAPPVSLVKICGNQNARRRARGGGGGSRLRRHDLRALGAPRRRPAGERDGPRARSSPLPSVPLADPAPGAIARARGAGGLVPPRGSSSSSPTSSRSGPSPSASSPIRGPEESERDRRGGRASISCSSPARGAGRTACS